MESNEIVNLIEKLNYEIYDIDKSLCENNGVCFVYESNGYADAINFLGIQIWNSGDDYRNYINEGTDKEDYEPLENFVRREVNNIIKKLKKVKL